jgi:hypothetical protein
MLHHELMILKFWWTVAKYEITEQVLLDVTLLTCILDAVCSNLGWDTSNLD